MAGKRTPPPGLHGKNALVETKERSSDLDDSERPVPIQNLGTNSLQARSDVPPLTLPWVETSCYIMYGVYLFDFAVHGK